MHPVSCGRNACLCFQASTRDSVRRREKTRDCQSDPGTKANTIASVQPKHGLKNTHSLVVYLPAESITRTGSKACLHGGALEACRRSCTIWCMTRSTVSIMFGVRAEEKRSKLDRRARQEIDREISLLPCGSEASQLRLVEMPRRLETLVGQGHSISVCLLSLHGNRTTDAD